MIAAPRSTGGAILSADQVYRYELWREWPRPLADRWWDVPADMRRSVLLVGLNPSTADAERDDPTIRRCVGFAKAWGYDRLLMGNLYGYRATDPRDLLRVLDVGGNAVGIENDTRLLRMAKEADRIVAAWGASVTWIDGGPRRAKYALDVLRLSGKPIHCLGVTAGGQPRHPLYLAKDTPLQELR